MSSAAKKPDKDRWSRGYYKRHIVEVRKFLWDPEYVKLLAKWIGFRQGRTVVDVGCGLGYLGWTYWPYFGRCGTYHGVDISSKLISQAKKLSRTWAKGGRAEFRTGDACRLPYPDDFADVVMCQTLLMHLPEPEKALAEMVRITKPGGTVFCKEPDNLTAGMGIPGSSLPQHGIDDLLFLAKISLLCAKGRQRMGLGSEDIGARLPLMMKEAGLADIDARMNDLPRLVIPPYHNERQRHILELSRVGLKHSSGNAQSRRFKMKDSLLAGGGTEADFRRYIRLTGSGSLQNRLYRKQVLDGTWYHFGAGPFYVVKGTKPKAQNKS